MRSTFFGIETMRRAILTHRRVMDTIGHNVANASTPGYSRQVVELAATSPFPYPGVNKLWGAGQIGTGVITSQIERVRDVFVDKQLRIGTTDQGRVTVEMDTLRQIENAFLEPSSEEGMNGALTAFFNAWQELSKRPESSAARNQVVAMARNLTDVINHIDQSLRDIRVDLNGQLRKDVEEVNRILSEIAALTPEIAKIYTHGDTPNDLLDKRDLLLDELSNYVNYDVIDSEFEGGIAISIGGRELLRNENVYEMNYDMAWDHPSQNTKTPYMNDVSQDDFIMLAGMDSGELKGIINSRDDILLDVQASFTELVRTIVDSVNNFHSQGLGIQLEDMGQVATTTADIGNMANYAQIASTSLQYFAAGDLIQIEDADGEMITVEITDTEVDALGNGRLYFDNIGVLVKADSAGANVIRFNGNGIDMNANIRKISVGKNNFFTTADVLSKNLVGDTNPDYFSTRMSTVKLPDGVTMNTTIGQLEKMFGIDITDNVNGLRLQLDGQAFTSTITESMTLDTVFSRINSERLIGNGGEPLEIRFDAVNRTVTISGDARDALSQLGGDAGSACNLFRVLGFEGYGIAGFEMPVGTNLTTTLGSLGVASGYIQIDNVVIQINEADSLQSALDKINAALNIDKGVKSYGTNIFFDSQSGRLRLVSPHRFAISTPGALMPAGGVTSNFLTVLGLQREENVATTASEQGLASITTSDIGARVSVNEELINNIERVATALSYAGLPGDNKIALDIVGVKTSFLMDDSSSGKLSNPTQTIDDYYNSLIADVGVESQKAIMDSDVVDNFLEYYQNRRAEVSGVSIDEEMTRLIEAEYAFQAASRMINVVDEMLDRVINGMGLVGR